MSDTEIVSNFFESKIFKSDEYNNFEFDENEYIIIYKNINVEVIKAITDINYSIMNYINTFFSKDKISKEKVEKYIGRYFRTNKLKIELDKINFNDSTSANVKRVIFSLVYEPIISKDLLKIAKLISSKFNHEDEQIVNVEVEPDVFYEVSELLNKRKKVDDLEVIFIPFPKERVKGNTNIHLNLVSDGSNFLDLKVDKNARFSTGVTILIKLSDLINEVSNKLEFIFNDNVRYYVKDYRVDNSIIQSLIENPYDFHILHNGISIVCDKCELIGNTISMDAAQIINGAQTIYNVVKVFKYGLMDNETIKDVLIVAKILVIDSKVINKITRRDISLAANTQKRIFQYDLSSNSQYILRYDDYFKKNNVDLLTKRGERRNKNSIQIDKFVKVLIGCIEQNPHKARNESIEKYFDENNLKKIFPLPDKDIDFYLSIRLLVAKIYLEWLDFKSNKEDTPLIKYGEKMAISYAFYKVVVSNDVNVKKKEDIIYNDKNKEIVLESFMKLNTDSEKSKWDLNDFRNEKIYSKYINKLDDNKLDDSVLNDNNLDIIKRTFKDNFIPDSYNNEDE